jgi:cytoskeleton protein RodZ
MVYGAVNQAARIILKATADSWIQLRDSDRNLLPPRILKPGDIYRVPDRAGLIMHTGNAGGIEVTVDGKVVPPLGASGMVKRSVLMDPARLAAGTAVQE